MDKIDFNDEEVFEKFKDFFDEDDIDEKQAQKIYKGLTEDEKEEFEQFLEDEELEIEEEEDRKKIKNSIVARQRSDII
ncbi:MAG: RNA polymerase subunit sigma, partial [Anaerococcus obesiensis]